MALLANRKSVMTLFTNASDLDGHRVRIVMAEKGVTADMLEVNAGNVPEDLTEVNPYATLPTLVDRELVIYDAQIISEYLDERFPHPPLMPVDPVSRARSRLTLFQIQRDWYPLAGTIETGTASAAEAARKHLREQLMTIATLFTQKPYFLSDDFSLVDCAIAPVLWRLPHYGVEMPGSSKAIQEYGKRVFARDSFRASLLQSERELR
jgi:RNA polymerase-associated protein